MRASFSLCHSDWSLQRKAQLRFGRQIYLLAFGDGLNASASACARSRANRRAFAAAKNAADDCPDDRASANFFRSVLAAR